MTCGLGMRVISLTRYVLVTCGLGMRVISLTRYVLVTCGLGMRVISLTRYVLVTCGLGMRLIPSPVIYNLLLLLFCRCLLLRTSTHQHYLPSLHTVYFYTCTHISPGFHTRKGGGARIPPPHTHTHTPFFLKKIFFLILGY